MNARTITSIIITGIQVFCVVDLAYSAIKASKRANKLEAELKALKEQLASVEKSAK